MVHRHPNHKYLAMALAGLAGFVDALGFLSLGGFFISFMSGNSTRFAAEAVHQGMLAPVTLLPLGVITLFVIGVMLGVFARHFARTGHHSTSVMALVCACLLAGALTQGFGLNWLALSFMVLGMGAVNNVFVREDGEVTIGVTYMTGALVKFGQRLAGSLLGRDKGGWVLYLLLWLGLVGGAITGALAFYALGLGASWIAAIYALILLPVLRRMERAG